MGALGNADATLAPRHPSALAGADGRRWRGRRVPAHARAFRKPRAVRRWLEAGCAGSCRGLPPPWHAVRARCQPVVRRTAERRRTPGRRRAGVRRLQIPDGTLGVGILVDECTRSRSLGSDAVELALAIRPDLPRTGI